MDKFDSVVELEVGREFLKKKKNLKKKNILARGDDDDCITDQRS